MENNKNVLVLNAWRIVWVQILQTKDVSLRQRATRGQEPSENTAASIQIYSNQTTGTPQYPIAWQQVIVFRVWIIWRVKTACGAMLHAMWVLLRLFQRLRRRIFGGESSMLIYIISFCHTRMYSISLQTTLLLNFIPYLTLLSVKK